MTLTNLIQKMGHHPMSDIIRLRGRAGPAIHLCMVLSLVIVPLMIRAMPERCQLMVGIPFFIELYLVMIPSLTCYAFDGAGITVRDPMQLGRSRVSTSTSGQSLKRAVRIRDASRSGTATAAGIWSPSLRGMLREPCRSWKGIVRMLSSMP